MQIKNDDLKLFLQVKLNKNIDFINEDDCKKIDILPLNGNMDNPENLKIDFSVLDLFSNVHTLIIKDAYLTTNDIRKISSYTNIINLSFSKCMFDQNSLNNLVNIQTLELSGCYNENYSFIENLTNLKNLSIVNPYTEKEIDLSLLKGNENIEKLVLDRCIIENFNALSNKNSLKYLSLLWTQLPDDYVSTINSLSGINELFIKSEYNTEFNKPSLVVRTSLAELAFDYENENKIK